MKVLSVFGTRPEVIKMAPVVNALKSANNFESRICVTSQHRSMQDQMLELFNITADYDLDIMRKDQNLFHITTATLNNLKPILEDFAPDLVLVQGDTTTTFAASLAASYCKIPVAHIEAGLRSNNKLSPFPEEINRTLAGHLATWHFAPTEKSKLNLLKENISPDAVFVTGNTVIDALLYMKKHLNHDAIQQELPENIFTLINDAKPYVLITGHRRESFGDGFENICQAIRELAKLHPEWQFIYPVHLNPNVQKPVFEILSNLKNVHLIEPIGYQSFVFLLNHSKIVLTDSGGVQEEAPSLGKPVLVMREVTERTEGVDAGTAKLVGTDINNIIHSTNELINNSQIYNEMAKAINPYGDGNASSRIIDLIRSLNKDKRPQDIHNQVNTQQDIPEVA